MSLIFGLLHWLKLIIRGYVIVTDCCCEVGPILSSLSGYTTYYAAVMRVGFVVTNYHCEVGSILSLSSGYTTYYAAVMRVGFVVSNCHCKADLILGSLLGLQLAIRGYVIATDCRCGGGSDFKFVKWVYDLLRRRYKGWVCSN